MLFCLNIYLLKSIRMSHQFTHFNFLSSYYNTCQVYAYQQVDKKKAEFKLIKLNTIQYTCSIFLVVELRGWTYICKQYIVIPCVYHQSNEVGTVTLLQLTTFVYSNISKTVSFQFAKGKLSHHFNASLMVEEM